MRFYRNVIILLLVLAALIAAYIFLPKPKDTQENSSTEVTVKTLVKDKIGEISIKNLNGNITLVKQGAEWNLSGPKTYKVDQLSTGSFIDQVSNVKADSVVEENAQDLGKFGLTDPQSTCVVKTTDGKSTTMLLGDQVPVEEGYYFKTSDSGTVYKIGTYTAGEFTRALSDFRDKTIYGFKTDDIAGFTLSKKGERILSFAKASEWEVITPEGKNKGSQEDISSVIDKTAGLKAADFIIDDPEVDLSRYGLADPEYTISITLKSGQEEFLLVGSKKDDTAYYVKRPTSSEVFTVSSYDLNYLEKGSKDYIKK